MKLHLTGILVLTLWLSAFPNTVHAQDRATQLKGPKDATSQFSGNTYGPIDAKDTLWRIAERYRQNKDLTVYQVMMAIYELNPDAFEDNNLNLLVDGTMLQLPSERYASRIDPDNARQRAEQDEQRFAEALQNPDPSKNIKPPVELASQQDLSQTKTAIEQQISQLDEQQAVQFDELRQQFAESINSVQAILDNNNQLYTRIEQVNEDLQNLRAQLEGDVKTQIDTQVELQQQLLAMMEEERRAREAQESQSIMNMLSQPMALILGTGIVSLLLVGGLITWLLRRNTSAPQPTQAEPAPVTAPPPASEMDDLSTSISDDLDDTAELTDDELFNDDDLLDDVLSSELEDALDDELENFAELDDDMLVPENEDNDEFEAGGEELDQDDLDNLFDEDDLSESVLEADDVGDDFGDDLDGIDLASDEDDELASELAQEADNELDQDTLDDDEIDDIVETATDSNEEDQFEVSVTDDSQPVEPTDSEGESESAAPVATEEAAPVPVAPVADADDKPEISIDELLDDTGGDDSLADTLGMESDTVNEEMLEKLEKEINDQSQQLDRLTDNIIGEIEQLEMMGDMLGDVTDDEDDESDEIDTTAQNTPSPQAIQDLDTITDDLDEIDIADMENAEDFNDPLSDDLISELQAEEENEPVALDVVDEVMPTEGEPEPAAEADNDDLSDTLSDELLAELEADDQAGDAEIDALSDELLSELEAESETQPAAVDDAEIADSDVDSESAASEVDDPLTDELLAELEAEQSDEDGTSEDDDDQSPVNSGEAETETAETIEEPADVEQAGDSAPLTDDVEDETLTSEDDASDLAETADDAESPEQQHASETPTGTDDLTDELVPDESDVATEESVSATDTAPDDSEATLPEDEDPAAADEIDAEVDNAEEGGVTSQSDVPDMPDHSDEVASADPLDQALEEFDKQLMDDIPSFSEAGTEEGEDRPDTDTNDFDDSLLDEAFDGVDEFELEQEVDGIEKPAPVPEPEINELEDVPGLDDWLSGSKDSEDGEIFDELENTEFDELLDAIEEEKAEKAQKAFELENPDLDLNALLQDDEEDSADTATQPKDEQYLDIESLMDDSDEENSTALDDMPLDLDVSLSDFTGVGDADAAIDIDKDAGQSANLDLARAYMEMDDMESARELLQEVADKGSDDQQEEAKELLKTLA
ncbi:AAA family ATPase [Alteromonas sp. ASW11-19]|uniref:AAA family ATPase n=1 Tax=Alteromonas salexigens TaxID=2982530 RepID=A0ABT2VRL5_9ALTE|nr:FimV/HubP family polar landmark protein [Alteromonas salexigens]MCU7555936.1 AAA family ATPase [Alteromonas salexigens]